MARLNGKAHRTCLVRIRRCVYALWSLSSCVQHTDPLEPASEVTAGTEGQDVPGCQYIAGRLVLKAELNLRRPGITYTKPRKEQPV